MIAYDDLKRILEDLEKRLPLPSGAYPKGVRSTSTAVQAFGLCDKTKGQTLPVIVVIGANYTQGAVNCPRDAPPNLVEDGLTTTRANLLQALTAYSAGRRVWNDFHAASSATIHPPNDFHLVLSNFCLWITDQSWQNLSPNVRANLLEQNPPFSRRSTAPGSWHHLQSLASALHDLKAIWVAQGMHCEVFSLFRQLVRTMPHLDWLLVPNLSHPYTKYGTSYPR